MTDWSWTRSKASICVNCSADSKPLKVVVGFDPVGLEPDVFVVHELLGDAAVVGEGCHAGDGGREFAEVAAPLGFGGRRELQIRAAGFGVEESVAAIAVLGPEGKPKG